jgi:CheY-like chemotaxis protein
VTTLQWLTALTESLARTRGEADAVLMELAQHLGERCGFSIRAAARAEGSAMRCLFVAGTSAFGPGAIIGSPELARFYGSGTVERLKGVRVARDGDELRVVLELEGAHRKLGAVLLGRTGALGAEELDLLVACARIGQLAAGAPASAAPPSSLERTAEHWEAIGRLTSTVLHELGNPVAFAALAASQLARAFESDSEQGRILADDLSTSVRQMAELLAELRRVSRGPEGASFLELRTIVEGAVRLAHAELRGIASITTEIGELPLVPGRVGSLGAGLAHLFSAVLRGEGGTLSVKASEDRGSSPDGTSQIVLVIEGYDFHSARAADAVRIVRGIATSADGRAELRSDGALAIRLPTVREAEPPSSRRAVPRPRLLVVEDEQALARALAAALGTTFEVVVATSAREALDRIGRGAFEAVLCDVHLADASGLRLYADIVAKVPALARRFALTSGGMDRETEEHARAQGLPILAKPFDWPTLERELERLVAKDP